MAHRDGGSVAIAIQIGIPGASLKRYDGAVEIAGLLPGGPLLPSGARFHGVAKANGGIRNVDVWDSREGYDQVAGRQSGTIEEIGVDRASIKVEFFEVHNDLGRIGSRS
jgi:hypothetical protein